MMDFWVRFQIHLVPCISHRLCPEKSQRPTNFELAHCGSVHSVVTGSSQKKDFQNKYRPSSIIISHPHYCTVIKCMVTINTNHLCLTWHLAILLTSLTYFRIVCNYLNHYFGINKRCILHFRTFA